MLSGQVASYVFLGFFQRARHGANMTRVLDLLRENLRYKHCWFGDSKAYIR